MANETNGAIPTDTAAVLQGMSKRLGMEERRPRITKAADLLGPALGPNAVILESLSDDISTFNGMWLLPPGGQGSPDTDKWWAGFTIGTRESGGHQYASTFRSGDESIQMTRGWTPVGGAGARSYSEWVLLGGWDAREDLSPRLLSGFTVMTDGVMDIRRSGKWREIRGFPVGTLPAGTTTLTSALPVADRPTGANAFGPAFMAGGNPGMAFMRINGEIAVTNMSGADRGNCQFSIAYTVD